MGGIIRGQYNGQRAWEGILVGGKFVGGATLYKLQFVPIRIKDKEMFTYDVS